MSKFDFKKLKGARRGDYRVNVIQVDGVIYQADLMQRKWYKFFGWVQVADLMQPIKDIDKKIEEAKAKIKTLESDRESTHDEMVSYILTFGNIVGKIKINNSDKSDPKDLKDALKPDKDSKKDKPKVKTRVLTGVPATPENRNNNNNGKQRNN